MEPLRAAAERGRADFAVAFDAAVAAKPSLGPVASVLLYRTLGPTLPNGAAAALWAVARRCALMNPSGVARAGFGTGPEAADRLFDAIVDSPSGVVITDDEPDASWRRIGTPEDCAGAVVFLSSRAASYITGEIITIDGGLTVVQIGKP